MWPGGSTARDWALPAARCATIRSRRAPWASRSRSPARVSFALGGALVGMAGAIQAHYVLVVSPHDLGFFVSLNFIIFLLFGGLQTIVGADAGCGAAHRAAGDAPLHQRVPAHPLRTHHRAGRAAPTGGVIDAHTAGAGVETLRVHAQVGPARRRYGRRPALAATALLVDASSRKQQPSRSPRNSRGREPLEPFAAGTWRSASSLGHAGSSSPERFHFTKQAHPDYEIAT